MIYEAYGAHRIKGLPPQWTGALQTFEVNPLFKIKLHYLFCKELNATDLGHSPIWLYEHGHQES